MKIDIRPRHKVLQSISGWYNTDVDYDVLPSWARRLYSDYVDSGSSLKFTRWLLKNEYCTETDTSRIGTLLQPVSFKISCKYNDLLRLADTKHYKSCFSGWRGAQQLRYLADPDIAVIYVPDKSGKFVWRALLRLVVNIDNKYCLLRYRDYGNSNTKLIDSVINKIYPLYNYTDLSATDLISVTTHNNSIVGHHIWSDHWCKLVGNKIHMRGIKYETNN